MKKVLSVLLVVIILMAALVSCDYEIIIQKKTTPTTTTTDNKLAEPAYKDSLELLNAVLTSYNASATEETMLYVGGGNPYNFETVNFEGPAEFIALEDMDYDANLGFPATEVSRIENAASMFNMMNVNIFNCYTVKLTSGTDANAMANTLKDNILNRNWACGMPEKLVIINCTDNYLLVVWGVVNDGGVVNPFVESVLNTVEGSSIIVETEISY